MDAASIVRSAPPLLEVGQEPGATYQLDEGLIAVRDDAPLAAGATFKDDGLAVVPVASVSDADEGSLRGPVYRGSGGGLGLPTGRVLVRFGSGDAAERHADALAAAGFQLEQVLPYAPHAAWLRVVGGGTVEALKRFPSLRELPGVEHVEPQVIAEASRRE